MKPTAATAEVMITRDGSGMNTLKKVRTMAIIQVSSTASRPRARMAARLGPISCPTPSTRWQAEQFFLNSCFPRAASPSMVRAAW